MITRERIAATEQLIRPYVRRTPVIAVAGADLGLPVPEVTLKLELLQRAVSFKARGAFANLLLRDVPAAGVVAASGGNHGVAVAYAARALGVHATIFVPTISSPAKVARIRGYGADLVVEGARYDDALARSQGHADASGALVIHAFDQVETMLGAGSLALELELELERQAAIDTVMVAVGGGGLIGGVASWFDGTVKVVGVEPEGAPTLTRALEAGRPVDAPAGSIAADSLAPRRVGELMFPIAQRLVEEVVLVTDDDIRGAQRVLWDELRLAVEPGGATALSALRSGRYAPRPGERVAVVLSGGNHPPVSGVPVP